ncbi:MAG: LysR family transcriptional regulator [Oscillospiraceae bacterium]|nr:LysR family transcriptional regulator [Oscillospiraceae bacterium]
MNYNTLRYFSVLAQVEHYTLAAARLGISQPSLSSAIRNLETELGVELFEKTGRNIRLTEQGRFLQKRVDAALAELNFAAQTLMNSREDAPIVIRIGVISGSMQGTVAREVAACLQKQQRYRFQITEGSARDLMDLLRQEKLDLAIVDVTTRDRSLHFRQLRQRDFFVALPQGHPLCSQSALCAQQLSDYPQIGFSHGLDHSFEDWASHPDTKNQFVCQVNTARAALSLVAAGAGLAVVSQDCVIPQDGVTYVPLENRHQALYLCIVYDRWLDPPVWDFVEQLVRAVRNS